MDFNAYFLHCPYDFNRYLTRKIDKKSYLHILIQFLKLKKTTKQHRQSFTYGTQSLFPSISYKFEKESKKDKYNKSSMYLVVFFLKRLIDI